MNTFVLAIKTVFLPKNFLGLEAFQPSIEFVLDQMLKCKTSSPLEVHRVCNHDVTAAVDVLLNLVVDSLSLDPRNRTFLDNIREIFP